MVEGVEVWRERRDYWWEGEGVQRKMWREGSYLEKKVFVQGWKFVQGNCAIGITSFAGVCGHSPRFFAI